MSSNSFQRSPSKVWWAEDLNDESSLSWHNRNGNGSPSSHKSQDSGFSDSEISPQLGATIIAKRQRDEKANTPKCLYVSDALLKNKLSTDNISPKKNFTENIKEKYSLKKSLITYLTDENVKKSKDQKLYERHNPCCRSLPSTPKNQHKNFGFTSKSVSHMPSPSQSPTLYNVRKLTLCKEKNNTEDNISETPIKIFSTEKDECRSDSITSGSKYHSPKVNRNLMNYFPKDINDNLTKDSSDNTIDILKHREILHSITLPEVSHQPTLKSKLNATIPLYYQYNLDKIVCDSSNNSSDSRQSDSEASVCDTSNEIVSSESFSFQQDGSSDSEKEIESFLPENIDKLEPPTHTSTPKINLKKCVSPLRKRIARQRKCNNLFETVEKIPEINPLLLPQFPPVKCWLNEVEELYEPECMTTLQSKSIANDLGRQVSQLAENSTAPIREMLKHSRIIQKEFNKIKTQLQRNRLQHISPLTQSLVGNITEYVLKNMVNAQSSSLADAKQTKNEIQNLLEVTNNLRQASMSTKLDIEEIYTLLVNLQDLFYSTEYNILSLQIQLLVNTIEEPGSHLSLRASLYGLTSLALQCERLSDLIVQSGGPRALLILCVECKASTIRTMALRTIATVCCSTSAIRQLEQAEGIEVLADILSDSTRPEPELSEALSVVTQITAPWIEDNHTVKGLSENIDVIITAITNFLVKTQCCQNLLLCAAALANITFMNVNAVNSLIQNNTIANLLEAVRSKGPRASIFLKEQTATLLANLSDISKAREHLAEINTGVALLCFLQIYPINLQDEAQSNAAQRLQQKSAIALSRLCSDIKVAQQIVELGGVLRLVQLCKEGKERYNSDAVLVACLATLRKIVANCGNEVMDQKDVMELVEPRLLDSFLAYSSQNESYV